MSWRKVKLAEILNQYRIEHIVQDDRVYKQISIINDGRVIVRGEKVGKEIGRKRQFRVDVDRYPHTLIFTRQLLLQGSIGIANNDVNQCIVTENMPMFSVDDSKVDIKFLALFIKSEEFKSQVKRIELSGSAQKSIHERTFLELDINLPTIKEQKDITNSFALFNITNSLLNTEIIYEQDKINLLRKAFLKEAMQGKLVPQNPDNEPASELLKKIKAKKDLLYASGKIRKGGIQEAELQEEILYDIPKSWVWCKLDDLCFNITDGTHQTPTYVHKGRIFLSAQNIKPFRFMPEVHKLVSEEAYQTYTKTTKPEKGDLLVARVGAGIGEAAVIDRNIDFCFYVSLGLIQPFKEFTNSEFLTYVFNSPYGVKYAKGNISSKGGSAGNFNLGRIRSFLIPLPPLIEQQRIVAKLDQLMTICDELDQNIQQNQKYAQELMKVALKEALTTA